LKGAVIKLPVSALNYTPINRTTQRTMIGVITFVDDFDAAVLNVSNTRRAVCIAVT